MPDRAWYFINMRVAYLTNYDSNSRSNWSGLGYYMARSLERHGVELVRINCAIPYTLMQKIRRRLMKVFRNKTLQLEREHSYLRRMAAKAEHLLSGELYDVLFSPGSLPVSFLNPGKPIVFFTDATYDCLVKLYLKKDSVCEKSLRQGNSAENRAISNASLIFYTSEWAVRNALTKYNADAEKIHLLNFGPNLPYQVSLKEMDVLIRQRRWRSEQRFLFIGVDWHRKGADVAIATVARLIEKGINATITLVGCPLPNGKKLPDFVTHYPFISKNANPGIEKLRSLFSNADFFLLPTQADCTPVVFSEAASFGLPTITTDIGGCNSVVIDGVTGYCIGFENFIEEASAKIITLCNDQESYEQFRLQAFYLYRNRLNWDVIGETAIEAIRKLIPTHSKSAG
jgi:glycosyltransferase involved in cell wall biosynthesis